VGPETFRDDLPTSYPLAYCRRASMTERARPAFEVYSTGKEAVSVEILTVFFLRVSRVLAHAWLAQGGGRCGLGAAVGPDRVAYTAPYGVKPYTR
jgi:hypothetical protein